MKNYNVQIMDQLEAWLRETGTSQAKAAPMIGLSQTELSKYRRKTYQGEVDAV